MDGRLHAKIENISIRGFRSLADVKLEGLPPVAVLIGANASGKSNVMRFFEMLGWMLRSSRLAATRGPVSWESVDGGNTRVAPPKAFDTERGSRPLHAECG